MSHPNRVFGEILRAEKGSPGLDRVITDWVVSALKADPLEPFRVPPVSSSLEAAVHLVPDKYVWRCWCDLETRMGHARLSVRAEQSGKPGPEWVECQFQKAQTPELALCVAALNVINLGEVPKLVADRNG